MTNKYNFNVMTNYFNNTLTDKYISTAIILFLVLYITLIAHKIPVIWTSYFNNRLIRLLILLLLAYISTKNQSIAIVGLLAFVITMITIQKHEINDKITTIIISDTSNNNIQPTGVKIENSQLFPPNGTSQPITSNNNIQPTGVKIENSQLFPPNGTSQSITSNNNIQPSGVKIENSQLLTLNNKETESFIGGMEYGLMSDNVCNNNVGLMSDPRQIESWNDNRKNELIGDLRHIELSSDLRHNYQKNSSSLIENCKRNSDKRVSFADEPVISISGYDNNVNYGNI